MLLVAFYLVLSCASAPLLLHLHPFRLLDTSGPGPEPGPFLALSSLCEVQFVEVFTRVNMKGEPSSIAICQQLDREEVGTLATSASGTRHRISEEPLLPRTSPIRRPESQSPSAGTMGGDDDDHGCSCGECCLCCCICVAKAVCNWYAFLAAVALAAVLVAAFGVALPVRATVRDASLARLDLINNPGYGGAPSLAYNLSLTVVLRNPSWAMRAELTAPLDAELRFAGRRFDGVHLAGAGRRIAPRRVEEFRVLAVSSPRGVALGADDAAAGFARERSASGVFELELKLAGEVRYRPVHVGRSTRLEETCPVKMLIAPPPATSPGGTHSMELDKVVTCY